MTTWSSPQIDRPILDVSVEDSINKQDKRATVVVDDPDGTAAQDFPKGKQITLEVDAQSLTSSMDRFGGFVAEKTGQGSALELAVNAFDFWLYEPLTLSVDNRQISDVLRQIITDNTPIRWSSSEVTLVNDRTVTREWRGVAANEIIAELAALSGDERFGVDVDNVFFFRPASSASAPRDFTDGEWLDYDLREDHRTSVNRVRVYYGGGDGDTQQTVVEDTADQQELGANMQVSGGVTTTLSKSYPEITDRSIAEERADSLLDRNEDIQVIELETWGAYDVEPNQETRVTIPEEDIDMTGTVASLQYRWRDTNKIRVVAHDEGVLDFIKKSKEETTRIDHKDIAAGAGGDPEDEPESDTVVGSGSNTPAVLESADMAAGDVRTYREFIPQGRSWALQSAGVIADNSPTTDLVARVVNDDTGGVIHATESKRQEGSPLVSRDGPIQLRFELANATGSSQTSVSARWVYGTGSLFQPSGWSYQVSRRNLGTKQPTTAFDTAPAEDWSVSTTNDVRSSAFVDGERAYVGDDDGFVRAYDVADGTELWSFDVGANVRSSPAVHNGQVYVGADDGNVYALAAGDGTERWRYSTGGQVRSSPAVANETVYVGSDDGSVYALAVADGSESWTYATGNQIRSSPAVADGLLAIGSDDNFVYGLSADDGTEVWTYDAGANVRSEPTIASGVVYVGSSGGELLALSTADGSELWTFAGGAIVAAPAVVSGTVYLGTLQNTNNNTDGALYAVGASSGTLEWYQTANGPGITEAPAVVGGVVVTGWADGVVRAHDANSGDQLWTHDTGASTVPTSPAIRDGRVFVGVP